MIVGRYLRMLKASVLCWILVGSVKQAGGQPLNSPPASWTRVIGVELVAPPTKQSGEPWDYNPLGGGAVIPGPKGTGGFSGQVGSSYPDMLLIVFDDGDKSTLYGV